MAFLPNTLRITIVLSLTSTILCAQAQKDTTNGFLQEVIVTTQRSAQPSLEVAGSTPSISQEYLYRFQPRTTPEALMGVNGVFIQKTNHGGGSPFLRGLTGNQTLILLDGIRLNNSTFRYGPNQYLNTIDPYLVQKIEVAKGSGSVQYGSDAIGGALQVFSKDPQYATDNPGWFGKAYTKYTTGDMEKTLRAEVGYRTTNSTTQIGATYRNFGDLIGGDTTGRQYQSGYKEFAFDVKSKVQLSTAAELTLAHQFLQQKDVPVYHKLLLENFAVNAFAPQQRMLNYAKLKVRGNTPFVNEVDITASWQKTIEGRESRKHGSSVLRKERDEVNTLGLTTNITSRFSPIWTANSGVELYHDRVGSSRQDINLENEIGKELRGLYPNNSRYGNYSLYSLQRVEYKKWIADAGVRYNFFSITINDTTLGRVKINPSSFVYNASLLYKVAPGHNVYATFNTGYRAPNVDDMGTLGIVDFRYEVPAYDLAPERSANGEVGYKVRQQKWAAAVSGYYMRLSNLVTRVKSEGEIINGYPVYRKVNTDKGYIQGVEAEVEYQITDAWKASGNVAYAKGQSITRMEPLRRIPPLFGRVLTTYAAVKWYASADVQFAGKQNRLAQGDKEDNRIPLGGTPGWQTVNLYGGYSFAALRLNLGVQNILNQDYRTHGSGINGVGRSAWVAVEVSL